MKIHGTRYRVISYKRIFSLFFTRRENLFEGIKSKFRVFQNTILPGNFSFSLFLDTSALIRDIL